MTAASRAAALACALMLCACGSHDSPSAAVTSAPAVVSAAQALPAAPASAVEANPMQLQDPMQAKALPASAQVAASQNDPFKAFLDNQKK